MVTRRAAFEQPQVSGGDATLANGKYRLLDLVALHSDSTVAGVIVAIEQNRVPGTPLSRTHSPMCLGPAPPRETADGWRGAGRGGVFALQGIILTTAGKRTVPVADIKKKLHSGDTTVYDANGNEARQHDQVVVTADHTKARLAGMILHLCAETPGKRLKTAFARGNPRSRPRRSISVSSSSAVRLGG